MSKHCKTQAEVVRYLHSLGYTDANKATVSLAVRNKVLVPNRYGFPKKDVEKWAEQRYSTQDQKLDLVELKKRKLAAEIRKAEADAAKKEHELKAVKERWLPREDFELEVAARLTMLEQILRQFGAETLAEIIEVVGGDPSRLPDAISIYDTQLDEALRKYADVKVFYAAGKG